MEFLWGFPGEPEEEYQRMSNVIPSLVHLTPSEGIGKLLVDRFSPYFLEPIKYGLINLRPYSIYQFVYPFNHEDLQKIAYHFDFDYMEKKSQSYIDNVAKQIIIWQNLWRKDELPVLNMMIVNNITVILDTRPCAFQKFQFFTDIESTVYFICESIHSLQNILIKAKEKYFSLKESELKQILESFIVKKLMLEDNGKYLSLANIIN